MAKKGKGSKWTGPRIIRLWAKKGVPDILVQQAAARHHKKSIPEIQTRIRLERNPVRKLGLQIELCRTWINYHSAILGALNCISKALSSPDQKAQKREAWVKMRETITAINRLEEKMAALEERQKIKIKSGKSPGIR